MTFTNYNYLDYSVTVDVDYNKQLITASAFNPYNTGSTSPLLLKMVDADGVIIKHMQLTSQDQLPYINILSNTTTLSTQLNVSDGGYDTSIIRQDNSGFNYSIATTMWELSRELNPFDYTSTIENSYLYGPGIIVDRRNGKYSGVPMTITRGDAVLQGTVHLVTGSNYMTVAYDKQVAPYMSQNLHNCIGEVISGSASGNRFRVTSHTAGNSGFYVDIDATSLSGQLVKLMPYRIVTSYSGWSYTGSHVSNLGDEGLRARFGLNETILTGAGSIYYTSGTYSGSTMIAHPDDSAFLSGFTAGVVMLKEDVYGRTISKGDIVYYNPASNPSATATGVVLYTAPHNTTAEGDFSITYWPFAAADSSSTYKIYRSNWCDLHNFPKFDKDYLCTLRVIARQSSIDAAQAEEKYVGTYRSPSVSLDFSANEYESQFATISETSHFHLGPINLSNGEMLSGYKSAGRYCPVYLSGTVYQGDPLSPTTVVSFGGFSTQNPNAAHKFNGSYFSNGVLTIAANGTFNASETLVCKAVATFGTAKIERVFMIPVQPTV